MKAHSPPERRQTTSPIVLDYVEDSFEHAQIAAEFALKPKARHTQCSTDCSGWQAGSHDVDVCDSSKDNRK